MYFLFWLVINIFISFFIFIFSVFGFRVIFVIRFFIKFCYLVFIGDVVFVFCLFLVFFIFKIIFIVILSRIVKILINFILRMCIGNFEGRVFLDKNVVK